MIGDNIIVNAFMFCRDHGDELCYICFCDHRMTNNVQIEDDLDDLTEYLVAENDIEERQPLNVYVLGAEAAVNTEESYQCEKHKKVDCNTCFGWVNIIKNQLKNADGHTGWGLDERAILESLHKSE